MGKEEDCGSQGRGPRQGIGARVCDPQRLGIEVAADEDALVKYLVDDDHQEDLLLLEQKLKAKKIAAI